MFWPGNDTQCLCIESPLEPHGKITFYSRGGQKSAFQAFHEQETRVKGKTENLGKREDSTGGS